MWVLLLDCKIRSEFLMGKIEKKKPEEKKRRKKRKSPVKLFFQTVLSIVLLFVIIAGGGVFAYQKITGGVHFSDDPVSGKDVNLLDAFMKKNIQLNVAVFGTDKDGTRTDVIFIAHFDSKSKKIGLLSVPRDTRVTIEGAVKEKMKAANRRYDTPCKINAVHAYGGKDTIGPECTVMQLESMLGITIDHYVRVDLDAFKEIVDAVGGVDMEVPQKLYHYDPDPSLNINLPAGMQHLDGSKALQLVRFRTYPAADLTRIQVQQTFLKEFAKKILNTENVIKSLPTIVETTFKYVKTDVSLADALKYVNYIEDVDINNIMMETLPGAPKTFPEGPGGKGVSYYVQDKEETVAVIDKLFSDKLDAPPTDANGNPVKSSKDKNIEVSNGGTIQGMAKKKKEELEEHGYTVNKATTYSGEKREETRIITREEEVGLDLLTYFKRPIIEVDPEALGDGIDIKIVIGLSEIES